MRGQNGDNVPVISLRMTDEELTQMEKHMLTTKEVSVSAHVKKHYFGAFSNDRVMVLLNQMRDEWKEQRAMQAAQLDRVSDIALAVYVMTKSRLTDDELSEVNELANLEKMKRSKNAKRT